MHLERDSYSSSCAHCFSACPAAVSLEVSRDGMGSLPVAAPQTTCAFTTIKLQLVKPEVVNAVTVRLHRPLDSSSLGLSQIRLMGTSAFSENSVSCGAVANDDAVSSTR